MDHIWKFVEKNKQQSVSQLLLSKQKLTNDELKFAVRQIEGAQYAKRKIPSWYEVDRIQYPLHISLEQCSSEVTARYKASLISGENFVDLTGGFGVDCAFIAESFKSGVYVEQQKYLQEIVAYNYKLLGLTCIDCVNDKTEHFLSQLSKVDAIFIDPARRAIDGGKVVTIADCEPNILELLPILKAKCSTLLIKLSPMLDITLALNQLGENVATIHVVSVNNECKELLFLLDFTKTNTQPLLTCVNFNGVDKQIFSFTIEKERETIPTLSSSIESYLYEPNTSILKSGAFNILTKQFNIKKLHINSHLYTSSEQIDNFPGRIFKVVETYSFDKQSLKSLKNKLLKANLAIRNFPSSVENLRKKLKIKEGGQDYLFATTTADDRHRLIHCVKVSHDFEN